MTVTRGGLLNALTRTDSPRMPSWESASWESASWESASWADGNPPPGGSGVGADAIWIP